MKKTTLTLKQARQSRRRALAASVAACVAFAAIPSAALAQGAAGYPDKPIHITVPFPPGGASDVLARLVGQKLQEAWGQPVLVENRPGANASIGASYVAKSAPDGYNLLMVDLGSLVLSPSLMPNLSYSPTKDLAPVVIAGYSPHILVVSNKLPVKTVDELVAYSKAHKGELSFGETPGAMTHLAGVLFAQKKGLDWNFIGYKGGAQVLGDLAGGQIDATMNSFLATYPMVKGGKIRLLAVASPTRFKPIPDTPTVAESIPGFVTGSYQGILAPAGTPKAVIARLHDEIKKIVATPQMKQKFDELGTEAVAKSPEEFGDWLAKETVFWSKVVKDGNVKVE